MKHLYKRFFPTVFATALVISSVPVYPSAAQADTSSDNLKILTRVYDTTNDSLLHYHYEDTNGNVVSLNDNTATTSSSKKKAFPLLMIFAHRMPLHRSKIRESPEAAGHLEQSKL